MSLRIRLFVVLLTLSAFVVLTAVAAAVYPGGNYHDRSYPRHHFWYNFLCDLLHRRGMGGGNNLLGSQMATAGMLALVVCMAVYWTLGSNLMPSRAWLGRVCTVAGLVSSAGLVAVALTPSDRLPKLHTAAIVLATAPGVVAAFSVVVGHVCEAQTPWGLRVLGVLALAAVVGTAGLFVVHTFFQGGYLRALPALQRVAAIFTVLWLATTTGRLLAADVARGNSPAGSSSLSLKL